MPGQRLTLTTRLTILYTLVSVSVLLGLGALVALVTAQHFVELDRTYLHDKAHLVSTLVAESPEPQDLTARIDELLQSHPGLFIQLERAGQTVYAPQAVSFPASLVAGPTQDTVQDWRAGELQLRGLAETIRAPASQAGAAGLEMRVLIATDTQHHSHFMAQLRQTLVLYVLLAALLSGLLAWWVARQGLAPLRTMKERAMTVTAHKLDQRMPVQAVPVEMADLAQSLNQMLERLQTDFSRLMEFSSDLAHELRTPISNLLTQTQVSLAQQRDASAYREILASNAEEFQRLARMVSDMLFLAKTEHGVELPHRERIALHHEVSALLDFYDAVAEEKSVRLSLSGEAVIEGDRLMIRRAISNLLSNALRHAPPASAVSVVLELEPGGVTLCVANRGEPIPAEHLPRLFDRFYRVDKSRAHPDSDGTGLGLSITRAIMLAHGGDTSVTSSGQLTTFCLRFTTA